MTVLALVMWAVLITDIFYRKEGDTTQRIVSSLITVITTFFCVTFWFGFCGIKTKEIKTKIPPKVEMIITEKNDGTTSQKDTLYIYKFSGKNKNE